MLFLLHLFSGDSTINLTRLKTLVQLSTFKTLIGLLSGKIYRNLYIWSQKTLFSCSFYMLLPSRSAKFDRGCGPASSYRICFSSCATSTVTPCIRIPPGTSAKWRRGREDFLEGIWHIIRSITCFGSLIWFNDFTSGSHQDPPHKHVVMVWWGYGPSILWG